MFSNLQNGAGCVTSMDARPNQAADKETMSSALEIGNGDFISKVFTSLAAATSPIICTKSGDPGAGGWMPISAQNAAARCTPNQNNFFQCSSFYPDPDGSWKARKENFAACHTLMLDDVGTKVPLEKLQGFKFSWLIETSPGNFQAGIVLESPIKSADEANRLHKAIIDAGLCDSDATAPATRWARLPVGINGKAKHRDANGKAFQCRLVEWNPEARYTVEQIVAGLSLQAFYGDNLAAPTETKPAKRLDLFDRTPRAEDGPAKDASAIPRIRALLDEIDPDLQYQDWLKVLMAIHNETGGCQEGRDLADEWSSHGQKYAGIKDIQIKWDSFKRGSGRPVSIGTLIKMVSVAGKDAFELMDSADDQFEVFSTEVVQPEAWKAQVASKAEVAPTVVEHKESYPQVRHLLEKYSLRGQSDDLRKRALGEVPILGNIGIQGQLMVIYASPNTGKTLITLALITEGIEKGRINPDRLFYLNMDDNSNGLAEKGTIADDYGFHMLADGFKGFKAADFLGLVMEMVQKDEVDGAIIVLDTLKKFVKVMDKNDCSRFNAVMRNFAMKGGTVIALAHTNKNPGADGKAVYSGTTDIVDDFDNSYVLTPVSTADGVKVVEFENKKRRGNNPEKAAYSYSVQRFDRYDDLLVTVKEVDLLDLDPIKKAAALVADEELIKFVERQIKAGVVLRMELVKSVANLSRASQADVKSVLERYTGEDSTLHKWIYKKGARGAHLFELLDCPAT